MFYAKLDERAIEPKRTNPTDAGLDLFALEDTVIPSLFSMFAVYIEGVFSNLLNSIKNIFYKNKEKIEPPVIEATKVKTGIALEIPDGYVGFIKERSSVGLKLIKVCGGVIDASYRYDVTVCLVNLSFYDYTVKAGDKIAQIVILPCKLENLELKEVLSTTERGDKAFGSSGR